VPRTSVSERRKKMIPLDLRKKEEDESFRPAE